MLLIYCLGKEKLAIEIMIIKKYESKHSLKSHNNLSVQTGLICGSKWGYKAPNSQCFSKPCNRIQLLRIQLFRALRTLDAWKHICSLFYKITQKKIKREKRTEQGKCGKITCTEQSRHLFYKAITSIFSGPSILSLVKGCRHKLT